MCWVTVFLRAGSLHVASLRPLGVCVCVRPRRGIEKGIKSQEGRLTLAQCATDHIFTAPVSMCSPSLSHSQGSLRLPSSAPRSRTRAVFTAEANLCGTNDCGDVKAQHWVIYSKVFSKHANQSLDQTSQMCRFAASELNILSRFLDCHSGNCDRPFPLSIN